MKLSSVIFDMDGVIIDSEPLWAQAQIDSLATLGIQVTEDDCERITRGQRIDELAQTWINYFSLNVAPEPLANQILQQVSGEIALHGKAMDGLYELLEFCQSQNWKIGLATSSSPVVIQAVFDKLKLWDFFNVRCSANDEIYGKPHPAVYLRALQKLNVRKEECIVIEDSVTGLIAAKAAGLRTFIVNPNYHQDRFAIADERLPSLHSVIARFENYR